MLTILYPKEDFTAADIAIKLQALASDQDTKIYIVPKHLGRNEHKVFQALQNTKLAILIITKPPLDDETYNELKFLISKKIPIYAFTPEGYELPFTSIETYKYTAKNKNELIKNLSKFIKEITKDSSNQITFGDLLAALGFILGGLLLLNALFDE